MFKYYYKFCVDENAYYVYLDKECKIFTARLQVTNEQDSFFLSSDLDNVIFIYEGRY